MRLRRILAVAAIMAATLAATAAAASACDPHRTNDHVHYYDGWWIPDYNTSYACLFGDEAEIYVTNPTVVAPNGGGEVSFSASWTGLQFESTNPVRYVLGQMGYENLYGGAGENFAAINTGGANWKTGTFTRPANGSYQEYEVVYSYSNNTFHF